MLILDPVEKNPLRLFSEDWIESMNSIDERLNSYAHLFNPGYVDPREATITLIKDQKFIRIAPIKKGFFASNKFLIHNDSIDVDVLAAISEWIEEPFDHVDESQYYELWLDIIEEEKRIVFDKDPFQKEHRYKSYSPKVIIRQKNGDSDDSMIKNKAYVLTFLYQKNTKTVMDITDKNTKSAIPRFQKQQEGQIFFFHENASPEVSNKSFLRLKGLKTYSIKKEFRYYPFFVQKIVDVYTYAELATISPISLTKKSETQYLLKLNEDDFSKDYPAALTKNWAQIRFLKVSLNAFTGYYIFTSSAEKNEWLITPILKNEFSKYPLNVEMKENFKVFIPDTFQSQDYENRLNLEYDMPYTKVYIKIDDI